MALCFVVSLLRKSFNGKPEATVLPTSADAFGLPLNDFHPYQSPKGVGDCGVSLPILELKTPLRRDKTQRKNRYTWSPWE